MNCLKCNTEIPLNGRFCPNCGTTIASEKDCVYCSATNPIDASFCASCGKSQTLSAHQPSTSNQFQSGQVDFAYLINEERILAGEAGKASKVPYGCVAVTLVNGEVINVQEEDVYRSSQDNSIVDFFKSVGSFLKQLTGQQKVNAKTYVLMNLTDLPILNYSLPVPIPGAQNGVLNFQFWVDARSNSSKETLKHLGLFFQKSMAGKEHMSLAEVRSLVVDHIPGMVKNFTPENLKSSAYLNNLCEMLRTLTGVSSKCTYQIGKSSRRRNLEISKIQKPVACIGCKTNYFIKVKFCEVCGDDLSKLNWIEGVSYLQAQKGEQLTLRISMSEDASVTDSSRIDDSKIIEKVMAFLTPLLRKLDLTTLMSAGSLQNLSSQLNNQLSNDFEGYLTGFTITDIRSAEEDWFFKTDALVDEELRKIESDARFLQVDDSRIDYAEAAFAIALRRAKQVDSQELIKRKAALELRVQNSELEIQELELETKIDLKKDDIGDLAEQQRLKTQTGKLIRETEFKRTQTQINREDEISEATHGMGLEKTVAKHDIELGDLAGEAQSRAKRREIADQSFVEDQKIRQEAERKANLGHIEEDLQDRQNQRQIDKLRAMAEMEAQMAQQDADFELKKLAEMKGLDAQQMLALQALQVVKAADPSQAGEIIKSIAESNASQATANVKEEMYKQMIHNTQENSKAALESQKSATDSILQMSEKTMETMSRVAVAAASGKKSSDKEDSDEKKSKKIECVNNQCDNTFEGKVPKFCAKCGTTQQ